MPNEQRPSYEDWPNYWFSKLEIARNEGNEEAARRCTKQLQRLGYLVEFSEAEPTSATQ